jgi:DNA-binding transcriptional regulator YiaG
MRDLTPIEQFLSENLAKLSALHRDPFDYDAAAGYFMADVARAVAQVLGESAPPARKMQFTNEFYRVLTWFEAGNVAERRLTPFAPPAPPLPPPEEHPAWVQQFLLDSDVDLTPAQMIAARRTLPLRQKDVARQINVSQWWISRWELGEDKPTREQLVALRKALELPPTGFPPERMNAPEGKLVRNPRRPDQAPQQAD